MDMGSPLEITVTVNGRRDNGELDERVSIIGNVNVTQSIKYTIVNRSAEIIRFNSYRHGYRQRQVGVVISDQFNILNGTIHTLQPSDSCWVKVDLTPSEYCGIYLKIEFTFTESDGGLLRIVKNVTFDCIIDDGRRRHMFAQLAPQNREDLDEDDDEEFFNLDLIKFPGYESEESGLERTLGLDQYPIPDYIKQLVGDYYATGDLEWLRDTLNIRFLNYENYDQYFNSMLYLEEIQQRRDIQHYTIKRGTLVKDRNTDRKGNTRYRLRVPGLAEKRPSVLRGDRLHITPLPPQGYKYEGLVDDTSQNDAYLVFNPRFEEDVEEVYDRKFRVEFTIDRLSLRLMHRAVEIIRAEEQLEDVVFPQPFNVKPMKHPTSFILDCYEKRVENNPEQLTAVRHIVAGSSRPAPYLIYGPPGTGKTFTLVEAIKQVCKIYPKSKILVCAPQNDAADIIAERLLDHVALNSVLRFNAASRSYLSMSDKILSISNYSELRQRVIFQPKSEIAKKQIVVSTLVTSGRLVSAEMNDHFTHIFIDEAGFATEPECVIPLGLLSPLMKMGGQLVLAGDPKQLGPIIRSSISTQHGFDVSLLERLMKIENSLYSRDQTPARSYDNKFVTKLLQNFRSHPEILEVPNQLFYEFELQPCANKEEREKLCGWQGLPEYAIYRWKLDNIGFPLVFRQMNGREEQERSSPSWFNRHEVLVVIEYVENLLFGSPRIDPKDIGIISPYLQQVRKIRQALRVVNTDERIASIDGDTNEIKVGSVEKFQGDEKEVIIISTVRSQTDKLDIDRKFNLGFVRNPKRFNVAITRAKALLVITGNPLVLCTDEKWRRMIAHIVQGGGYLGEELGEELLRIDEDQQPDEEIHQVEISNEDYRAAKASGDMSEHILHQDDQWEHNK